MKAAFWLAPLLLVAGTLVAFAPHAKVFVGDGCQTAADPLPGATGQGASIWSRLPKRLKELGLQRPVVLAVLAVDASSIAEWTDSSGVLKVRLDTLLGQLRQAGLSPDAVLWQQGESDARQGTSTVAYAEALALLRGRLRASGVVGPLVLARSTTCHGADGRQVRAAMDQLAAQHPDVRLGPDTDLLVGELRQGGCHFSNRGLDAAALMWAQSIASLKVEGAP